MIRIRISISKIHCLLYLVHLVCIIIVIFFFIQPTTVAAGTIVVVATAAAAVGYNANLGIHFQ